MKETVSKISENITIIAIAAAEGEKTTAVIDIEGVIGYSWEESPNTAKLMRRELKAIGKINAEEISVNIHSLGGSVDHGLAIHDLLRENKAKIITNIYGMSASAATLIAQSGDVRRVSINSLYLVHHAWNFFIANAIELKDHLDDMEKIDSRQADIYARRSGKSKDYMLELMNRQNGNGAWLEPDEVLEHGLCDEIFEPEAKQSAAAAVRSGDFMAFAKKMHLPNLPENWQDKFAAADTSEKPKAVSALQSNEAEQSKNKSNQKPANNKPLTKENTMEPDFKAFKEKFGAEGAMSYLEAGLSFEQAQAAHTLVTPLNEKISSLTGEKAQLEIDLAAANALLDEYKNEYPLEPDNSVPPKAKKDDGEEEGSDPVADFEAKVIENIPKGKEGDSDAKASARSLAAVANPELYDEYCAALQPQK